MLKTRGILHSCLILPHCVVVLKVRGEYNQSRLIPLTQC